MISYLLATPDTTGRSVRSNGNGSDRPALNAKFRLFFALALGKDYTIYCRRPETGHYGTANYESEGRVCVCPSLWKRVVR